MTELRSQRIYAILLSFLVAACGEKTVDEPAPEKENEYVVVYSSIDEQLTAPVYRAFTAESGIRIQQVTADDDRLLQRMLDKTYVPAADLFLAAGVARLWRASDLGVLRPTYADSLDRDIPGNLSDPGKLWFGVAVKANAIVYDSAVAVEPGGYESLAEPRWRGRLCLSSAALPENIALIAFLIERHGERPAELIVRQLVANLAQPVFADARSLMAAIESGQCAAGIAALDAAVQHSSANAGSRIAVVTPPEANGGTQVDVVGAGVTRHAGNAPAALRFMLWIAGDSAQEILAESFQALPAVKTAAVPQRLRSWQGLYQSETSVSRLGALRQEAADLAERARYR